MPNVKLKNSDKVFEVSDCDFDRVSKYVWNLRGHRVPEETITTVIKIGGNWKTVTLGRFILGLVGKKDVFADHKDRNIFNNTRENLRPCDRFQNAQNRRKHREGFKGINFDTRRKKYRAFITSYGKTKMSPRYETAIEAARAYDKMARELHGEFAVTNF